MLATTRAAGPRSFSGAAGSTCGLDAVFASAVAAVVVDTGGGGAGGVGVTGGAGAATGPALGLGNGCTAVALVVGAVGPAGLTDPSAAGR